MLGLSATTGGHDKRSLHRGGVIGRGAAVGTPAPSDIVVIVVVAGIGVPTRETQVAQAETEVRISGTSREETVAQIVVVDGHIELMIRRIAEIQHAVAYFPIETVVTAREGAVLVEVDLLTPTRAGSVVIRLEKQIGVARIEWYALSRDRVDHGIEHAEITLPLAADDSGTTAVAIAVIVGVVIIVVDGTTFVVIRIVHAGREEQGTHEQDGQRPKERVDSFHNRCFVCRREAAGFIRQM